MSAFQIAEPGWLTIELDPKTGKTDLDKVWFFELTEDGITPLVKNMDGVMVEGGPDVVDVVRATPMDAAKISAMYRLKELADRATTERQLDAISEAAGFVMAWDPRAR